MRAMERPTDLKNIFFGNIMLNVFYFFRLMIIPVQKLPHAFEVPEHATPHSAGMDLYSALQPEEEVILKPLQRALIPIGFCMALPQGYEAQIRPRSGLAFKYGITVLNTPGTIDCDYRGEIKVLLINLGEEPFTITRGLRIAQMVIASYNHCSWQEVPSLEATIRGGGGFGSTGG